MRVKPAGLGARDLLRLEMAYLLYGNDMNEETTPIEAGAEWVVKFDKGEFIGRAELLAQQSRGATRRLVAFELVEKAVPRHGFKILSHAGASCRDRRSHQRKFVPVDAKGYRYGLCPACGSAAGITHFDRYSRQVLSGCCRETALL